MTLIGFYINHVWKWTPGRDPREDFKKLTQEELDELKKQWGDYLHNTTAHSLAVQLLDEEWDYLKTKADQYGLSRSGLIEQFIKDFAGYRSNGSDEEDLANAWYNRNSCNYSEF